MTSVRPPRADAQRPLRADARRNREKVLRAAAELFASGGLATSLDEIARHAGVGPGTVHRHFPSKESLLAAVTIDRMERMVAAATAAATTDDPGAAFFGTLDGMLDEGTASAPLKAALEGTGFDLRVSAPEVSGRLRDAVATLLERAQEAGAARADLDVAEVMAVVAAAFAAIRHADAATDPTHAARLRTLVFAGLHAV